jgi:hypothetical protein
MYFLIISQTHSRNFKDIGCIFCYLQSPQNRYWVQISPKAYITHISTCVCVFSSAPPIILNVEPSQNVNLPCVTRLQMERALRITLAGNRRAEISWIISKRFIQML